MFESCFTSSVFPTPVGPTKRRFATGRSLSFKPERDALTAFTTAFIACFCPNITLFNSSSRFFNFSDSFSDIFSTGILAVCEIIFCIIDTSIIIFFLFLAFSLQYAPASSIISIALSGSLLSFIYLSLKVQADFIASSVYFTL